MSTVRLRASAGMIALRAQPSAGEWAAVALREGLRRLDPGLVVTLVSATALVSMSAAWFYQHGQITVYGDSQSRLLTAARVVDARHNGLGQLGSIWPILPQLSMAVLAWVSALLYSGLAGTIPSAGSYLIASAFMYNLVRRLTDDRMAALTAVFAFSAPSVLYFAVIPMSEMTLLACLLGIIYYTVRWVQNGAKRYLVLAAVTVFLGSLTRYEAWMLGLVVAVVILFVSRWRRASWGETEDLLVLYSTMAALGAALWLVWNWVIDGDALYWLHSQYSTQALNTTQLLDLPAAFRPKGNLSLAVRVFTWASVDFVGPATLVLAGLGLVRFSAMRWSGPECLACLLLLFPVPFSVAALVTGAEVITDEHVSPSLRSFNLVYALMLAPAAGYLCGWLARGRWLRWPVVLACVLIIAADLPSPASTRLVGVNAGAPAVGPWLRSHYSGGLVLVYAAPMEPTLFTSRIPVHNMVYEGDQGEWRADLVDPSREIRWIVVTTVPSNPLWRALNADPRRLADYRLVHEQWSQQGVYRIYERKG